ncbi:unnamed protein product, partial [Mesorhabditis spiculigera]
MPWHFRIITTFLLFLNFAQHADGDGLSLIGVLTSIIPVVQVKATCFCHPGWQGSRCDVDINECDENPCQNDAICENTAGSWFCNCREGFHGQHCQFRSMKPRTETQAFVKSADSRNISEYVVIIASVSGIQGQRTLGQTLQILTAKLGEVLDAYVEVALDKKDRLLVYDPNNTQIDKGATEFENPIKIYLNIVDLEGRFGCAEDIAEYLAMPKVARALNIVWTGVQAKPTPRSYGTILALLTAFAGLSALAAGVVQTARVRKVNTVGVWEIPKDESEFGVAYGSKAHSLASSAATSRTTSRIFRLYEADVGEPDQQALIQAVQQKNWLKTKEFLDRGVDPEIRYQTTALHAAMENVEAGFLRSLLTFASMKALVNSVDRHNLTPLMLLAKSKFDGVEPAEILLEHGALVNFPGHEDPTDTNVPEFTGRTALHVAVLCENKTMIHFLCKLQGKRNLSHTERLEKTTEKNCKDALGQTPLMYAAKKGLLEICQILVENKVALEVKDDQEKMAHDLAKEAGHQAIANLLRPAGDFSLVQGFREAQKRKVPMRNPLAASAQTLYPSPPNSNPTKSAHNTPSPQQRMQHQVSAPNLGQIGTPPTPPDQPAGLVQQPQFHSQMAMTQMAQMQHMAQWAQMAQMTQFTPAYTGVNGYGYQHNFTFPQQSFYSPGPSYPSNAATPTAGRKQSGV